LFFTQVIGINLTDGMKADAASRPSAEKAA